MRLFLCTSLHREISLHDDPPYRTPRPRSYYGRSLSYLGGGITVASVMRRDFSSRRIPRQHRRVGERETRVSAELYIFIHGVRRFITTLYLYLYRLEKSTYNTI